MTTYTQRRLEEFKKGDWVSFSPPEWNEENIKGYDDADFLNAYEMALHDLLSYLASKEMCGCGILRAEHGNGANGYCTPLASKEGECTKCCDGECNHDDCCGKISENCKNNCSCHKKEEPEEGWEKELKSICIDIWAKVNDSLQKHGVKYKGDGIGTAYGGYVAVQEIVFPRIEALLRSEKEKWADEVRKVIIYQITNDKERKYFLEVLSTLK